MKYAAKILDLEKLLDSKPKALSGGQRQRVAMGRAIVREPKVFLMDEPLSNLDAKLRVQMRTEISKLHERLGTTMIYVTHDQTEAMTLGTRIVVMKDGVVQQVDTPNELYEHPREYVCSRVYRESSNEFLRCNSLQNDKEVTLKVGKYELVLPEAKGKALIDGGYANKVVSMGIRPENVHDLTELNEESTGREIETTINVYELLGSEVYLYFNIDQFPMTARVKATTPARVGDKVKFKFDMEKVHVFDNETGIVITN